MTIILNLTLLVETFLGKLSSLILIFEKTAFNQVSQCTEYPLKSKLRVDVILDDIEKEVVESAEPEGYARK